MTTVTYLRGQGGPAYIFELELPAKVFESPHQTLQPTYRGSAINNASLAEKSLHLVAYLKSSYPRGFSNITNETLNSRDFFCERVTHIKRTSDGSAKATVLFQSQRESKDTDRTESSQLEPSEFILSQRDVCLTLLEGERKEFDVLTAIAHFDVVLNDVAEAEKGIFESKTAYSSAISSPISRFFGSDLLETEVIISLPRARHPVTEHIRHDQLSRKRPVYRALVDEAIANEHFYYVFDDEFVVLPKKK